MKPEFTDENHDGRSPRLVIVDDNPENLRTLKAILENHKYETYAAINGTLALDAIKEVLPDLVLLDIMMPGLNGYEVCQRLKSDETTREIPVLFISALDESMDKIKAFEVGGVDYISKPFQSEEVLARVKTHISLYKTRKQLTDANVTLKKHSLELEARNKELETFSYTVSHDLRAPLRVIDGYSVALTEDYLDKLDETGREYLSRIRGSVSHMSDLIDAILELSRVSRSQVTPIRINISSLCEKIITQLESSYPGRKLTISIMPGLSVTGDNRLIEVAFSNLLENAWKYTTKTDDAWIKIFQRNENNQAIFCIQDNGVGFDAENANKLFSPFQRMHSAKEFEGTGIGLATVQRIIQLHGGKIWAESKVNEGATFCFKLPE